MSSLPRPVSVSRLLVPLLCLIAAALPAATQPPADQVDPRVLVDKVAEACGSSNWATVKTLSFSWTHHPSARTRSYTWRVLDQEVEVTMKGGTATIPQADPGTEADKQARAAHQAFINDVYWLLFPLQVVWDDTVSLTYQGRGGVPQLAELGETDIVLVRYPDAGGYTPGDSYALYIDAKHQPVAWAYFPAGTTEPRLVTTWENWESVGGLTLPTLFKTPDGKAFISIDDLKVE